jgi:hypothetical protein
MREPGTEATGTVGAADVHVESGLKMQAAKLADADERSAARCENEGVGSRLGHNHGFEAETKGASDNLVAGLRIAQQQISP